MPPKPDRRLPSFVVFVFAILAVPVGVIALGLGWFAILFIAEEFKLGWVEVPVHYRFTFGVEVGGVAYNGATVTKVTYQHIPKWQVLNGPGIAAYHKGEASCLKLTDGRMICLLPDGLNLVVRGKYYYPGIGGLADRLLSVNGSPMGLKDRFHPISAFDAATVTGSSEIPINLLPPVIVFDDPGNPSSVHLLDPEHPEALLGPGSRFLGARIAVTNEPVSQGIETVLPWLAASKSSPVSLNRPGDPFLEENHGKALVKDYFY